MRESRSATVLRAEEIVRWQMLGKTIDEIAISLNMAPNSVSELTRTKAYSDARRRLVDTTYEEVDKAIKTRKADEMLADASGGAAEALIALLDRSEKVIGPDGKVHDVPMAAQDVRLAATAILDRGGYGPIQRKMVRQRFELDPMMEKMFRAAMNESEVKDGGPIECEEVSPAALEGPSSEGHLDEPVKGSDKGD